MDGLELNLLHCLRINSVGLHGTHLYIKCIQASIMNNLRLERRPLIFVHLL
jgi:hypothetical protein